jgi:ABC-type transporter Mla subunit MlaD
VSRLRGRGGLALLLLVALVALVVVVATRPDGTDEGTGSKYLVRATFGNASFVIPGEQVKVAGVIAGKIQQVDLDANNRAVVVLDITDPGYQDFRQDATCRIGLQSLIGEQYVDCTPTQRRGENVVPAPPLDVVASGPGKGQHALPVGSTSSPVGPDLLANIMRVPERERLRLIVGELGVGLTGNGAELKDAIARANPTLQQAGRLVALLATQNRTLADLADRSDQALAPLAARSGDLSGFTSASARVGAAAAARGDDLERDLERLPGFLAQLRPATTRISRLADQLGPSVANLAARAPQLNTAVTRLGPFAQAATPALTSLGKVADQGRTTIPRLSRLATQLRATGTQVVPVSNGLADLGTSFDRTGGVANLLRTIYLYTGALNGKDGTSHYQRTTVYASNCIERTAKPFGACPAQFLKSFTGAPDTATSRSNGVIPIGASGVPGEFLPNGGDVPLPADPALARAARDRVLNAGGDR